MKKQNVTMLKCVNYQVHGSPFSFPIVGKNDLKKHARVNIFASGPSIKSLIKQGVNEDLLKQPSMFVNGSISLLGKYDFTNISGYVVTDARFISHALSIIQDYYTGQAWFMTLPVLDALISLAPDLVIKHHNAIHLIYSSDKQIHQIKPNFINNFFNKKKNLYKTTKYNFSSLQDTDLIVDKEHHPMIGVSLDMDKGFIEAGTVAFAACQLAFSMQAKEIHLFGVDLMNSNQPRFYENKQNKAPIKLDKAIHNRIVPSFNLMIEEYGKRGCVLYNHSPISKELFNS